MFDPLCKEQLFLLQTAAMHEIFKNLYFHVWEFNAPIIVFSQRGSGRIPMEN